MTAFKNGKPSQMKLESTCISTTASESETHEVLEMVRTRRRVRRSARVWRRVRASLSEQTGAHHRTVRSGRRDGHPGKAACEEVFRKHGPDFRRRQPARRERTDRHRARGEFT